MSKLPIKKKRVDKRSEKRGLPPGTLVYVGNKEVKTPKIIIFDYNEADVSSEEFSHIDKNLVPDDDINKVRWINIEGIQNIEAVEQIGNQFKLHPLLLEDILNTDQRPKYEDYGNYEAIFIKMLFWNDEERVIEQEQVALILGKNYLISFHEEEKDLFNPIRQRILQSYGRIRQGGSDYLLYALIDIIIDNYFVIIEKIGDDIEELEDKIELNPNPEHSQEIQILKRIAISFRRSVWPLREVINKLQRADSELIDESIGIYFRDLYDHIIQIIDNTESFRELISGLRESYITYVSNRMNQIINVLTIISSVFIPLSFLSGFYGMNFLNMPELKIPWAYPTLIIVMISITIMMLLYFKRKKWL